MEDETFVDSLVHVSNDVENLFIRLTPRLHAKLLTACPSDKESDNHERTERPDRARWSLKNDVSGSFLPLEINLSGFSLYASFNGGLLEDNADSLQIPDGLLLDIPCDATHARVRVLPSVEYATRVFVDPLNPEDWDLLQVHADLLEGGGLLKSVSLVYKHQRLTLRIPVYRNRRRMHDLISLVVKDISSTVDHNISLWPSLGPLSEHDRKVNEPMHGLVRSDTEIILTPMTPTNLYTRDWSKRMQLIPAMQDIGRDVLVAMEAVIPMLYSIQHVQVGCIFIHPNSCPWSAPLNRPDWVEVRLVGKDGLLRGDTVARVVFCGEVRESCAVLHPWLRWSLGAELLWDCIVVRPCASTISVSLDQIALQPVRFEPNTKPNRTWMGIEQRRNKRMLDPWECDELTSRLHLSLGSYIILPVGKGSETSAQLFRLTLKKITKVGSLIVTAGEWKELSHMANKVKSGLTLEVEFLGKPSTDRLLESVNLPVLNATLEASASLLKALQGQAQCICILYGATGAGKTQAVSLVGTACAVDGIPMLYVDCRQLLQLTRTLSEILSELDCVFQRSTTTDSCLIVLDDLDRITPNLITGSEGDPGSKVQGSNPTAVDQSKVIADRILQLYAAANMAGGRVSILSTCASDSSLHVSLFSKAAAVGMGMPDSCDRLTLFSHFLQVFGVSGIDASKLNFGQPTEGFRPRDLEKLAARTKRLIELSATCQTQRTVCDALIDVLDGYSPLSCIGLENPNSKAGLSWCDIGGLFSVKKKLEAILLNPVKYRSIYQQAKIRLPRGILLLGPTGCGKSCLVPALAEACKFPLISCKGPEVLDKFIGASEAKVRALFQRAAAVAPSILFLDEMDALAPRRGSDHTGVTDRVVNQILTFLDGVEDTSGATVYVIAASSRPDKIDPALLRPGRLEQHLYIGPPETDLEWIDLVRKIVLGWKLSIHCRSFIMSEAGAQDLLTMVKKQPLVCPADLKAAMDTAQLNAVHRTLRLHKPEDVDHVQIEVEDLTPAFMSLRPCLSPEDASMLETVYNRYRSCRKEKMRLTNISRESLKVTLR